MQQTCPTALCKMLLQHPNCMSLYENACTSQLFVVVGLAAFPVMCVSVIHCLVVPGMPVWALLQAGSMTAIAEPFYYKFDPKVAWLCALQHVCKTTLC